MKKIITSVLVILSFTGCYLKKETAYNFDSFDLEHIAYIISSDSSYNVGDNVWAAENPPALGPGYWICGREEPLKSNDTLYIAFKDGVWCRAFEGKISSKKDDYHY